MKHYLFVSIIFPYFSPLLKYIHAVINALQAVSQSIKQVIIFINRFLSIAEIILSDAVFYFV